MHACLCSAPSLCPPLVQLRISYLGNGVDPSGLSIPTDIIKTLSHRPCGLDSPSLMLSSHDSKLCPVDRINHPGFLYSGVPVAPLLSSAIFFACLHQHVVVYLLCWLWDECRCFSLTIALALLSRDFYKWAKDKNTICIPHFYVSPRTPESVYTEQDFALTEISVLHGCVYRFQQRRMAAPRPPSKKPLPGCDAGDLQSPALSR